MKVKIPNPHDPINGIPTMIPVITSPHNIQFDHAKSNCLFLRVHKFPKKEIMRFLADTEDQEFSVTGGMIRAAFKKQGVFLCFVVNYSTKKTANVKRSGNIVSSYTVTEKQHIFSMYGETNESEKQEIIRFVDPFAWHLRASNNKESADILLEGYHDWAHPLTFEKVTADLTEDQKLVAAKILHAYFSDPA